MTPDEIRDKIAELRAGCSGGLWGAIHRIVDLLEALLERDEKEKSERLTPIEGTRQIDVFDPKLGEPVAKFGFVDGHMLFVGGRIVWPPDETPDYSEAHRLVMKLYKQMQDDEIMWVPTMAPVITYGVKHENDKP
jgi:hypothetical protein